MAFLLITIGCQVAKEAIRTPARLASAVVPSANAPRVDPAELQAGLLRSTDELITTAASTYDVIGSNAISPEERRLALRDKIALTSLAIGIAGRPNPYAGLLDLIALTTLWRRHLEESQPSTHDPSPQPWLTPVRVLETNIWSLAAGVLTDEQHQELRKEIGGSYLRGSPLSSRPFSYLPELASNLPGSRSNADRPEGLFRLVGLDPMAGLDPAVREVTRSRLLAERALFTLHRMPFLLRWQSELLADDLLSQPRVTQALAQTEEASQALDRISRAADSLGRTAATLPDRLSMERQALVASLESNEGRLRELGTEWGRTIVAGQQFSTALTTTLETFDRLMNRFGVGAEADDQRPKDQGPSFNVLDYAQTAEQLTAAAEALDRLVKDLGGTLDSPGWSQRIADLDALAHRARQDVRSLLNHAFLLGSGLVLLAFGCALLFHRWTGGRRSRAST